MKTKKNYRVTWRGIGTELMRFSDFPAFETEMEARIVADRVERPSILRRQMKTNGNGYEWVQLPK